MCVQKRCAVCEDRAFYLVPRCTAVYDKCFYFMLHSLYDAMPGHSLDGPRFDALLLSTVMPFPLATLISFTRIRLTVHHTMLKITHLFLFSRYIFSLFGVVQQQQ